MSVVTQGAAKLGYGSGKNGLGNVLPIPRGGQKLFLRHHFTGLARQVDQHVHVFGLDLNLGDFRTGASDEAIQAWIYAPLSEAKACSIR